MSAIGGVEIVGAAVLLMGGLGVAAAAAAAVAGVAAVAGTGYVAYHGLRLGARGAEVAGELAAAGMRTAVATGEQLVKATEHAIVAETARQHRAYEERFTAAARETASAIAAMQAKLGAQRATAARSVGGTPAPEAAETAALLAHAEALLATPTATASPVHAELAARIAEALVLCQEHPASPTVGPLREALRQATAAGADLGPAALTDLAHRLEALLGATRDRLDQARATVQPLLARVAARMELLELGARHSQDGSDEAARELAGWRARFLQAEQEAMHAPDRAPKVLQELLADLDGLLEQGRQELSRRQQDTIAHALLKTLKAQGYQVVSDGPMAEDRRIAVSHLAEKRRVIFRISPGGRLVFDVMDGYHGEACLELLESVWAGMEREGVVFGGPPRLDQLDDLLRHVGFGALADKYRFLITEPEEAGAPRAPERERERS